MTEQVRPEKRTSPQVGDKIYRRSGDYFVLDFLAQGGMSQIYRARYLKKEVDRVIILKKIRPDLLIDESNRQMFIDEIKATFGFNHPNLVQCYDYGISDGQVFVVMEYVPGRDLKFIRDKLQKTGKNLSPLAWAYIISEACRGLHYAHNFEDALSGQKLNIIHRDISPHNIMVNYSGMVKVVDFGIAKATTNKDVTETNMVKGKISYIPPEALRGQNIDHRYDQFAIGVTLWELIVGKRAFDGKDQIEIISKIANNEVAPASQFNKNCPAILDGIIAKMVQKDPANRYSSMEEARQELINAVLKVNSNFGDQQLKIIMSKLFQDEISDEKKNLLEFGKIDIDKINSESSPPMMPNQTASNDTISAGKPRLTIAEKELDLNSVQEAPSPTKDRTSPEKIALDKTQMIKINAEKNKKKRDSKQQLYKIQRQQERDQKRLELEHKKLKEELEKKEIDKQKKLKKIKLAPKINLIKTIGFSLLFFTSLFAMAYFLGGEDFKIYLYNISTF